ncbi:MAG: hypothetical protein KDJ37_14155 [Hyphomicrobiaceae bacterium]|nr:hypothetical protein [Hyphomicrobiaceae bacterium]
MRQFMIDMMILMMPAMKPMVWIGVGFAILGIVLLIAHMLFRSDNGGYILFSGRILLGLAVFFLACQVAGMLLGMPPKINFGDFEKMEFILVPFWQIGAAFLAVALALGFIGGRTRQA